MHEETGGHLFHHGHVHKAVVVVLLLLALFLLLKSVTEFKGLRFIGGGVPVSNTITVSGEGEVFAVPDIATFTFSVIEEAQTVKAAQNEATRKTNIALELLENKGIAETDIQTTGYNVYPRYEFRRTTSTQLIEFPDGRRELVGFEVNQTVTVKVRDTEIAGEVLAEIGSVGVSSISGLNFTIDDEDDLVREARQMAIDEAQTKAEELAADLGVNLVRVVNFNEQGNGSVFRTFDAVAESAAFGDDGLLAPNIPVGENRIVSNVNITYEIR